jgi:hypothetical protein
VLKFLVLRRQNAASMAFWVLPPAVFITVFINCFFVLTKVGGNQLHTLRLHCCVGGCFPILCLMPSYSVQLYLRFDCSCGFLHTVMFKPTAQRPKLYHKAEPAVGIMLDLLGIFLDASKL